MSYLDPGGRRERRRALLASLLAAESGGSPFDHLLAQARRRKLRLVQDELESWLELIREAINAVDYDYASQHAQAAEEFYASAGRWEAPIRPPRPSYPGTRGASR